MGQLTRRGLGFKVLLGGGLRFRGGLSKRVPTFIDQVLIKWWGVPTFIDQVLFGSCHRFGPVGMAPATISLRPEWSNRWSIFLTLVIWLLTSNTESFTHHNKSRYFWIVYHQRRQYYTFHAVFHTPQPDQ